MESFESPGRIDYVAETDETTACDFSVFERSPGHFAGSVGVARSHLPNSALAGPHKYRRSLEFRTKP